jgi:hypothetical protein
VDALVSFLADVILTFVYDVWPWCGHADWDRTEHDPTDPAGSGT